MMTEDEMDKAIHEANERERYLWRHTRWFYRALQICAVIYFISLLAMRYFF